MSDPHRGQPFPKGVLYAAGSLVIGAMILTAVGQSTGIGTVMTPDANEVHSVDVRFEDRDDGGIVVKGADGAEISVFEPGSGGFVRGVLRGLARDRRLEDVGPDEPFSLTLWSDGRLSLADPSTGREIELNAFGKDNAAPFARLLAMAKE